MSGMLIAILSGALMSIQGIFNTEVTRQSSLWVSTGWVQLSAFIVCLAAWFSAGREPVNALFQVTPKYLLLGGAIGAFITITVVKGMDALGPAKATMLIVTSQLSVSYLVELLGWFQVEQQPFLWRKLLGMAVAIAGILLFQWES